MGSQRKKVEGTFFWCFGECLEVGARGRAVILWTYSRKLSTSTICMSCTAREMVLRSIAGGGGPLRHQT